MSLGFPQNTSNKIFLINEAGKRLSYFEFYDAQFEFQKYIDKRKVVLVLCDSTMGSVMGLFSFLINGQIPLLLEKTLDIDLIKNIINRYQVEYIFITSIDMEKFPHYEKIASLEDYVLLKTDTSCEEEPHKDLALLLSTSGTTGSPKMARLSYRNVLSNADSIITYLDINSEDRAITTLPISYSFGLSIMTSHMLAGASIILTKYSILERGFWDAFENHRPTSLSGVPFTFEMLKKIKFFYKQPSNNLRTLTQAGGKMRDELIFEISEFSKKYNIDFYVMYGQTEATARISFLDPESTQEKIGSIGKAIPGGVLSIGYIDKNVSKKFKSQGELIYSGPNVMMGYAEHRSDLTKEDELNGVLATGDVATVDEDGYYFIIGRLKRFIKISGKRLNLEEVENILQTYNYDAACVGKDDRLFIYSSEEGVIVKLKRLVCEKFKLNPLTVEVEYISEIPRTVNGKIDYKELEKRSSEY